MSEPATARVRRWVERAEALSARAKTLTERVQPLVDRCQGAPLRRDEWIADGWPRALALPLLLALPFLLSALVRVWLGWSLRRSLWPALALSLLAVWPFVASFRAQRRRHERQSSGGGFAFIAPLLLATGCVALLYNRAFAGLTNYAGGDGGVHAHYARLFAADRPEIYQGFVSMYALTYWIERVGHTNVFWALCGIFYAGVAVVAGLPSLVAGAALHSLARSAAARWAGRLASFIAALVVAWYVILPQQHYHQTDGFFAHLFALVPLFALWLVDATTQARLWRWLWIGGGALVYRYTYGLNLPDLALALSALAVADSFAPGMPVWLRWPLRATPIGALLAARLFFRDLEPLLRSYGWIVPYPIATVMVAQVLLVLVLALTLVVVLQSRAATAARALRLPLAFVAANWVSVRYLQHLRPTQPYYLLKYPMHALVLGAAALVVVATLVAVLVADALVSRPRRLGATLLGLVALASSVGVVHEWRVGSAPLRAMFEERVFREAPYHDTRPLADLGAWTRIDRVLAREHRQFGGYITSYWPMFHFMNAAFDYYNGGRAFWERGFVKSEPGYCVFWDRGKVDWWTTQFDLTAALSRDVGVLERMGSQECIGYRAHWNTSIQRTLCYRCE